MRNIVEILKSKINQPILSAKIENTKKRKLLEKILESEVNWKFV